jgi:3-methyladenine DNA glycosylase AlkD
VLKKQYTREIFVAIETFFTFGIHNWAHADMLGMWVLPELVKQNIVDMEDFEPWLISEYKFQRRCVPVTLIKSLKTAKDFNKLFEFIEPLMNDAEREVHQGVGWFLREAWKKNHEETELFLMKHKNTAPRLIIQYATEKMTKEQRLDYRKEK